MDYDALQEVDSPNIARSRTPISDTNDAPYAITHAGSPLTVDSNTAASQSKTHQTHNIDILLVPGFSLTTLSSIVEPLRAANEILNRVRFSFRLASLELSDVQASSGISISGGVSVSDLVREIDRGTTPNLLIVCSGTGLPPQYQRGFVNLLRSCRRRNVPIAGMGNAAWILAEAGLLSDGLCTVHWKSRAAFLERHHDVAADNVLFVNSGSVTCCGGELAAFDFAINYINETCGQKTAQQICQHFLIGYWRSGETRQPSPGNLLASYNHHLDKMIELMTQNLEEPLSINEIASAVSLSRRQVERIFSRHASTTPGRFYKSLRVDKAQQLIEQTSMSIIEIALACGFASASHFTASFKSKYGVGPLELRKMKNKSAILEHCG